MLEIATLELQYNYVKIADDGRTLLIFIVEPAAPQSPESPAVAQKCLRSQKPSATAIFRPRSWFGPESASSKEMSNSMPPAISNESSAKSCFPGFWGKNVWPPNSPDFNPMDYRCGPSCGRKSLGYSIRYSGSRVAENDFDSCLGRDYGGKVCDHCRQYSQATTGIYVLTPPHLQIWRFLSANLHLKFLRQIIK